MERCPQTGKVMMSHNEAIQTIHKFRKRGVMKGKDIPKRAYVCPFCGAYHLTHWKKRRGKKNIIKDFNKGGIYEP